MSAITVGSDLVHYEVLGRGGRPVILVHGWLGSWRYWIPTMRQLQLKYRVYALDLFGFGDSSKNPERYTINQQIELLDDFMKQLGIPKAAILAHGLGAHVAIEFAKQYPDKVARMLLASAPVFDSGDLATRVRPGQKVMLTATTPSTATSTSINPTIPSPLTDATIASRSALPLNIPTTPISTAPTTATPKPLSTPLNDDGETEILVTGVDKAIADPTVVSANRDTVVNPSLVIDREKLREAALIAAKTSNEPNPKLKDEPNNPLRDALSTNMADLLAKCFKKSESEFEKLQADVTKSDSNVLKISTIGFDAGMMLDTIRLLSMPVVLVHGQDDPIITAPNEAVWDYLTIEKEEQVLPVPMSGVRHFPMLESDTFQRLVGMFLETPEISKIELKERWRRRSR
ncbi:MAG: alpha/beta hydrolase [Anaerolineae bacterium]|jgi:pimeloyl-ACP methyl ester carboxylesterase|nr:alpha/beta hydrolase [Anaerolineae bacterium]